MSQLNYSNSRIYKEELERFSSVGELQRSSYTVSTGSEHLNYPGVRELSQQARYLLEQGSNISFETSYVQAHPQLDDPYLLNDRSFQDAISNPFYGIPGTLFGSLLIPRLSNIKLLANYNLAYIEAKAASLALQSIHRKGSIDHFYLNQGIANLNLLEDIIKAHEIHIGDLPIFVIPANGIKAFRNTRMGPWALVESKQQEASFNNGSVLHINQEGQIINEIPLIETHISNLFFPIYKVKLQDRWIIVVPAATDYASINAPLELKLESNLNKNPNQKLKASIGQAVRAIYELFGGSFDNLPEALLNFEGGSWSSIVEDHSSSSRHLGTHSMHEIIKNHWLDSPEIAIPWNYLVRQS